jgi:hypothetical protein
MDLQKEIERIDRARDRLAGDYKRQGMDRLAPWQIMVLGAVSGALFFGGGMAFAWILGAHHG